MAKAKKEQRQEDLTPEQEEQRELEQQVDRWLDNLLAHRIDISAISSIGGNGRSVSRRRTTST